MISKECIRKFGSSLYKYRIWFARSLYTYVGETLFKCRFSNSARDIEMFEGLKV